MKPLDIRQRAEQDLADNAAKLEAAREATETCSLMPG